MSESSTPMAIAHRGPGRSVLLAAATLAWWSCGGDSGTDPDPGGGGNDPKPVATVEITPADPRVFEDGSLQLTARTLAADGTVLTGRAVAWSSSNGSVGQVEASGRFAATDPGTTTLTATAEGVSAQTDLTVLRSNTAEVRLSTDELLLGTGDVLGVTAEAVDSAGRVLRGRSFTWSTDDASVAGAADGQVTGIGEGVTVLRASAEGAEGLATVDVFIARGLQVPSLAAIDAEVVRYMRAHGIPGAVTAVARDGRLVYSRSFGVADLASGTPMQPDQVMRWGSVSKPVAGVAAMMLVEAGVIALDDLPFQSIPGLTPLPGETPDPRIAGITLENLLDHAGGWDDDRAVDGRLWLDGINRDGVRDQAELIRYGLGVPLDHDPGTTYAYSNYATQVVAEYIAFVTGTPYEAWVQQNIFAPLGVSGPRFGTGDPGQEPEQPTYHDMDGTPLAVPVLDLIYSGASGAWIGTAQQLMRFVNGIEGRNGPALLEGSTQETFTARPEAIWPGSGYYYTNFMSFTPSADGLDWNHVGLPRGGLARILRRADGTSSVVMFNRTPAAYPDLGPTLAGITDWPDHDLFGAGSDTP